MGKTEVPGSLEGFSAQEKQAFYELMRNTDDDVKVWIEKYDDVSVQKGTDIECIQLKSATGDNNPLTDRSVKLWKSLSNWVDKLQDPEITSEVNTCKCRYSVSSPRVLSPGTIATLFHTASSESDAELAFQEALSIIGDPSESLDPYTSRFFLSENKAYAITVIRLFSYEIHHHFLSEIKDKFHEVSYLDATIEESVFKTMCGWIRCQASPFTEYGKPALLPRVEYRKELTKEGRRLRDNPLSQAIPKPSDADIHVEKSKQTNYLIQLQLIDKALEGSRDDIALDAITEKLRSDCLIITLAKYGTISSEGLEAYQDELVSEWKNERQKSLLSSTYQAKSNEAIGASIFLNTRTAVKTTRLEAFDTPWYFSCGQLHGLADTVDDTFGAPRIGWHPNYRDFFTATPTPDKD